MDLSRKQIKLLKFIKTGKKLKKPLLSFDNVPLKDLNDKKLVQFTLGYNDNEEFTIEDVKITSSGIQALTLALESKHASRKEKILFPLFTNVISAIVGALVTYLLMK